MGNPEIHVPLLRLPVWESETAKWDCHFDGVTVLRYLTFGMVYEVEADILVAALYDSGVSLNPKWIRGDEVGPRIGIVGVEQQTDVVVLPDIVAISE